MSSQNSTNKKNIKKLNKRRKYLKNKCVYVMVSKTSTIPSQMIKMWTREPYAHTSLALDIELKEMYSFARKKLRNPFNCGFITEDITSGVFGRDVGTTCKIMRVWITQAQLDKINKILKKFKENKNYYKYNYIGIFGVMINKPIEREYNYFCSQFVYYVLSKAGVKLFDKKPGLARPEDFRVWSEPEVIYEGKLNEYRAFLEDNYPKKANSDAYVEKRGINFEKFSNNASAEEEKVEEIVAATLDEAVDA